MDSFRIIAIQNRENCLIDETLRIFYIFVKMHSLNVYLDVGEEATKKRLARPPFKFIHFIIHQVCSVTSLLYTQLLLDFPSTRQKF